MPASHLPALLITGGEEDLIIFHSVLSRRVDKTVGKFRTFHPKMECIYGCEPPRRPV